MDEAEYGLYGLLLDPLPSFPPAVVASCAGRLSLAERLAWFRQMVAA